VRIPINVTGKMYMWTGVEFVLCGCMCVEKNICSKDESGMVTSSCSIDSGVVVSNGLS
jgi:hypothetical protein